MVKNYHLGHKIIAAFITLGLQVVEFFVLKNLFQIIYSSITAKQDLQTINILADGTKITASCRNFIDLPILWIVAGTIGVLIAVLQYRILDFVFPRRYWLLKVMILIVFFCVTLWLIGFENTAQGCYWSDARPSV